jgi:hypothetical protein
VLRLTFGRLAARSRLYRFRHRRLSASSGDNRGDARQCRRIGRRCCLALCGFALEAQRVFAMRKVGVHYYKKKYSTRKAPKTGAVPANHWPRVPAQASSQKRRRAKQEVRRRRPRQMQAPETTSTARLPPPCEAGGDLRHPCAACAPLHARRSLPYAAVELPKLVAPRHFARARAKCEPVRSAHPDPTAAYLRGKRWPPAALETYHDLPARLPTWAQCWRTDWEGRPDLEAC